LEKLDFLIDYLLTENKEIKVTMKGGNLFITFNGKEVVMKGPATEVFSGKI